MHRKPASLLVGLAWCCSAICAGAGEVTLPQFLNVLDPEERGKAFEHLQANWSSGLAAPLIEVAALVGDRDLNDRIFRLLKKKTGQDLGASPNEWYLWLWSTEPAPLAWYADFKAT